LSEDFEVELVEATLERASVLSKRFGAESFDTIYIGGGTPSLLSPSALERLLGGIELLTRGTSTRGPSEWTVEANPDSLGAENLEIMNRHGVTRLSIGVQSLDRDELATLGRRHRPEAALDALRLAAEAGMSVSADLIAGIPSPRESTRGFGNTDRLAHFARELLDAGAAHLSIYDLTIEENTPLATARKSLRFPDEDEDWEARQRLESCLFAAGMRRYEVSNYAAIGNECRHNLAYWRMDSYIGAGPGAVSTIARASGTSLRIEEPRKVVDYRRLAGDTADETEIGLRDAVFESIMMAFRTSFGLDLSSFRSRFGLEAEALIGDSMAAWDKKLIAGEPWPGFAESRGPALLGEGLDFLNRFLGDCLEELHRKMPVEF
jgi:oxygen-independent coproporphyrinogen-3 oxidase